MSQRAIPAVFMRGGSSKGLFFHAADVPETEAERNAIFARVLGSPDPYARQLDGMGGGISSLSKAVIIGPPTRDDCDVDYHFAQVSVTSDDVDWQSNCGNLASAVGPFAIDEGLISPPDGIATVRIHQVNTKRVIHARIPVENGKAVVAGDQAIAGVSGTAARIELDFIEPGGAFTDALLPTGEPINRIDGIEASIVDATHCGIFTKAEAFDLTGTERPEALDANGDVMSKLDMIRRSGAVMAGLASKPNEAGLATPRIAILHAPTNYTAINGTTIEATTHDIGIRMVSMGNVHRAVPLTSSMCLAVACKVPGTIAHQLARDSGTPDVRIAHPSGVLTVGADVVEENGTYRARRATVIRTARRLMQGEVLLP